MENQIINLQKFNDQETLKELITNIVKVVNVNHIYLMVYNEEETCEYRFILVIEEMAKRFKERARTTMENYFDVHDGYSFSLFTINVISEETNQGNTFFLNNCKAKNLVYSDNSYNPTWLFKKVDFLNVIQTAEENFNIEKEKIVSFGEGAMLYIKEKKYEHAAFMLHQTIELSYMVAERFLIGKRFKGHLIGDHQAYIRIINSDFGNLFTRENENQINLLNKLNLAYTKTRYAINFKISKEQILKIKEKSDEMMSLLNKYINVEISKGRGVIDVLINNKSVQELSDYFEDEEKNKELSTLGKIKTLSQQNLNLLSPIGGIKKGYYLNYVRVYDYSELFDTLKSMLNVCILALEGQQDCTLDIYHKESDVKRVLSFAKYLIPFEEGNFLDEIRELILNDTENIINPTREKQNH